MVAIDLIKRAGNEAVEVNPPTGTDIHITNHGSNWYFAALALFGFVAILKFVFAKFRRKNHERVFHYFMVFSLFVLAIAYYTMGSNLGWTGIQAEFNHVTVDDPSTTPGIRQIFYTRYIGWFLAFPPLIACLAVLNNVTWSEMIFVILCFEVWIVSLLIGALIQSTYKWGYFVFGVVAFLVGAYNIVFPFRRAGFENTTLDRPVMRVHLFTSIAIVFVSALYFICWGLSEGGNVIQPDSEAAFYGVLDVVIFVIIGSYFLWGVRTVDFRHIGIGYSDRAFLHERRHSADTVTKEHPGVAAPPHDTTVPAGTAPGATTGTTGTTGPNTAPQQV